ncbi:MAG: hypothetical protein WBP45_03150 [Daejeonella sp.]
MATWAALYIKTSDEQEILNFLSIKSYKRVPFPIDFYSSFLLKKASPNYILIGKTQPEWITIILNSYDKLEIFCKRISKEINSQCIIVFAQTVSDYYYFALYDKGVKIREIENNYDDETDSINFGEKLQFEKQEEDELLIDFESIMKYSRHLGVMIPIDLNAYNWIILKGSKYLQKIPWWKFW